MILRTSSAYTEIFLFPPKRASGLRLLLFFWPFFSGRSVLKPNQVWATDITYIRLASGFLYLVAIMDWFSRFVISWNLSNTLEVGLCLDCLGESLEHGKPVYLKNYVQVGDAWTGIKDYLKHYNETRIHQSLEYHTHVEIAGSDWRKNQSIVLGKNTSNNPLSVLLSKTPSLAYSAKNMIRLFLLQALSGSAVRNTGFL